jgi:hypothetical protein
MELIVFGVILVMFGIPAIAILTEHQRKMVQLQLKQPEPGKRVATSELTELRQQLTDLRDLTTKYDLSFDQALQRIESRVGRLEERMTTVEQSNGVEDARSR